MLAPRVRILAWVLVIPILGLILTWSARTLEMYQFLALRNLADQRLGGMTLQRAGELQFYYLQAEIRSNLVRAVSSEPDDLPRMHLFVRDSSLEQLDSALPRSGFDYVEGYLLNQGQFDRVKLRYRGDFATHWGLFKRSLRVKTRRAQLFHGMRKFNLNATKSAFLNGNHFGYEMAREIGLLTPDSALVKVSVNGKDKGLHLFVEQPGETFLRNAGRLPGDIYKGDQIYGREVWYGLELQLFDSSGLWEKMSYNNHYPEHHDVPLRALLDALNSRDWPALTRLMDLKAFARLNLWEQLASSRHNDNDHNWRLYYDPGLGKFEPILWDGMPWSEYWLETSSIDDWTPPETLIASRLMAVLHEHEPFIRIKQQVFHEFVTGESPARLVKQLKLLNAQTRAVAETELVILDERNRRIPPDESIARMDANVPLLERIIDHLRRQYGSLPSEPEQVVQTVNWEGVIEIKQDTTMTDRVVVQPGTRILLHEGRSLFFRNKVMINGSLTSPVTVRAVAGARFGALVLEGVDANGSVLSWLDVSGGTGYRDELREYSGMVSIHNVKNVTMSDCRLSGNHTFDDQLHLVYSSAAISGCIFENAPFDAIDLDMSEVHLEDSVIRNNGNDGVDLMGSQVSAKDLVIEGNGDKGLSVGERSILSIADSTIEKNEIGVQTKDDSFVSISSLSFTNNAVAVDAYKKNWRYGAGGYAVICDTQFRENGQKFTQDRRSVVIDEAGICPVAVALTKDSVGQIKRELLQAGTSGH